MYRLLWAERQKIRRLNIFWISALATIMVAVIIFGAQQSQSIDNISWYLSTSQLFATLVLPALISLLGSYMICREEEEGTMKSLQIIPVNEAKLTTAKMIITFIFSILLYLLLFVTTLLIGMLSSFSDLSLGLVLVFMKEYFLVGVGVFMAISPIIALVSFMKKGYLLALLLTEIYSFLGLFTSMSNTIRSLYPITAIFGISGYYEATTGQILLSCMSLLICMMITVAVLYSKNTIKGEIN